MQSSATYVDVPDTLANVVRSRSSACLCCVAADSNIPLDGMRNAYMYGLAYDLQRNFRKTIRTCSTSQRRSDRESRSMRQGRAAKIPHYLHYEVSIMQQVLSAPHLTGKGGIRLVHQHPARTPQPMGKQMPANPNQHQ